MMTRTKRRRKKMVKKRMKMKMEGLKTRKMKEVEKEKFWGDCASFVSCEREGE